MEFFPQHHPHETPIVSELHSKNGELYDVHGRLVNNNRAMHGDHVYLQEGDTYNVVGIKTRTSQHIVGILHLNKSQKYGFTKRGVPIIKFTPISNKYPTFMVPTKSKERVALYCVISINKWEQTNKVPIGQIEKMIGPVGVKEHETDALLYKNHIYPKRQKMVANIIEDVVKCDKDIYETFSIDPVGCCDIDDAFHVKKISNSQIEIGIHIADVASRLDLDKMSFSFFSSIYLDGKQINMLPDNVTYNDASLGNGELKRAVSLILSYTYDTIHYTLDRVIFKPCLVNNKAMSYQKADSHISHGKIEFNILHDIAKQQKGDVNAAAIPATKIVEYFMLLYNTHVAETLFKHNNATILRRHLKCDYTPSANYTDSLEKYLTRTHQHSAEYIRGDCESDNGNAHQSLGLKYYTHATSPIRRFVDVINQANILRMIDNKPFLSIDASKLSEVNLFNKNLRKFYNNYKKLQLIFDSNQSISYTAFITEIKEYKIKVYIPVLDIDHFVRISSHKLSKLDIIKLGSIDDIDTHTFLDININEVKLTKYEEVTISITILPYETIFNNKIYCQLISPDISIL